MIVGDLYSFGTRKYFVTTISFGKARELFKSEKFDANNGRGEQREIVRSHIRKIKRDIQSDNFTPAPITVGLKPEQRKRILHEAGKVKIMNDAGPFPLLDGGHRMEALEEIFQGGNKEVLELPITAVVLLTGNTKADFINLQLGRAVDRAHLLSMSTQEKMNKGKDADAFGLAIETAKLLNKNDKSAFFKQIRFDSRGSGGIPISSLCSKGSSDIGTSFLGGARIALAYDKDAVWLAEQITLAYQTINTKLPDLLKIGMVLCPPPDGTKGGATMLTSLGNMLAYRLCLLGKNEADEYDLKVLVDSVKKTMDIVIKSSFTGPQKREMLGDFADKFFADVDVEEHHGIPRPLIDILSTSTFAVPRLPKEKKAKPAKAKDNEASEYFKNEEEEDNQPGLFDEEDEPSPAKQGREPEVIEEMPDGKPVEAEAAWSFSGKEKAPWEEELQA